jgi:hypothetical protein
MRDLIAAAFAVLLLVTAVSLGSTLHMFRKTRQAQRRREHQHGRRVVAELPSGTDMILFSEDDNAFFYRDATIGKRRITAVRVLINGSPIAAYESKRFQSSLKAMPTAFKDRSKDITHDRWDVAIETIDETTLVECGAIRERISQELARRIFDCVKLDLVEQDDATGSV